MVAKRYKNSFTLALLVVLLPIAALCSLGFGETSIPLAQIPTLLADGSSMEYGVLAYIRIPRMVLAVTIGGGLSLSGVILQGIYRNPLVEPYTLGISGGASLGITFVIVTGFYTLSAITLPLAGFLGALLTILFVYTLSMERWAVSVNRMLLIGVMFSFISSSTIMFLMSIASVESIHNIVFWTMGSLNESNSFLIKVMVAVSVSSLALSYLFVAPLNALRLGELKARHLGVNTQLAIRLLFIITSLLTGSCIAVGGIIGFVGLIIPHLSRLWVGTDYRILLITSFLSGGIFLLICDLVARTIISPNELPIGVITGIIGGITFIVILSRPKSKSVAT